MADKSNYYVVREKAVPEVLLKVVEAKRLLDSGKLESVQDATESAGGIVNPHFRRGYFKRLESDFYKNKKGQIIFVHETVVNAQAKTLIET